MPDDHLDLELRYSWDWFSYHAGQRLTAFNFFLVLMGAIVVGYTQAVLNDLWILGVGLGALGVFVALAFLVMDVRNEELVSCGRAALDDVEKRLDITIRADDEARKYLPRAREDAMGAWLLSHSRKEKIAHRVWLRRVISMMGLLSLAACLWALLDFPGQADGNKESIGCGWAKSTSCLPTPPAPR